MIEYEGEVYRVFDAHTHWSRLMSRRLRPLLEFLSTNELLDYVYSKWDEVKARTRSKRELKLSMYPMVLDKYGIDRAICLPVFQRDVWFSKQAEEMFPDRIVGFGGLLPRASDEKLQERFDFLKKHNYRGIKLHAQYNRFNVKVHRDELSRVLGFLEENKMIALFHTGSHFNINDLNDLLRPFEDLVVILGHSGLNSQVDQALRCARDHANVYLETSGNYYTYMFKHALKDPDIGPEKILYGSDLPTLDPTVEMSKILELPLSEEERHLVFWKNANRILNL